MSTASRVIKNTGFLYIKMGITLFVSLLTTRMILASLGASDFGIFNVVGGAIGLLGFLNSTLANATQRFMSYAEGEGILDHKKRIFNISIVLHLFIAVITAIILIGMMYPLFNGILNIPSDRLIAAKVAYISLICSTLLSVINVPYDALMNAHENMLYYSIVGVFESLLKLGVAFVCVHTKNDKLIVYGVLMTIIPLITLTIMKVYCHRKYEECLLDPFEYWDTNMAKRIASFSGWNFLTAISSLFSAQGLNLVLNHFFGTRLNAAQGIASQMNGQLSAFSATMLKALNPVIVKKAGAKDMAALSQTTLEGCKFSTLLIMLFAIPFILEMPYVLHIWLDKVPEWTVMFCALQLIQTLICQMANPAATAVYAQGDIKSYALYKSIMNIMPLILSYVSFHLGGSPIWLYIPMIVFWAIGGDIVIIFHAVKKCSFKLSEYLSNVCQPIIKINICMVCAGLIPIFLMSSSFTRLMSTFVVTTIAMTTSLYLYGMNDYEKNILRNLVKKIK